VALLTWLSERVLVELTIHRLLTGLLKMPAGTDPGNFIVSGGELPEPMIEAEEPPPPLPTTRSLIKAYLDSQKNMLAESYRYSQAVHIGDLAKHLGSLVDGPYDQVKQNHLETFLRMRLAIRNAATVARELVTLIRFYNWASSQESLASHPFPARGLSAIKFGRDRDPFRTLEEIRRIIERGGLADKECGPCLGVPIPQSFGI
jgi:hypothetical protein